MNAHLVALETKSYILNALLKLTERLSGSFGGGSEKDRISRLVRKYETSMSIELQQRSVEYSRLLGPSWDSMRSEMLLRFVLCILCIYCLCCCLCVC